MSKSIRNILAVLVSCVLIITATFMLITMIKKYNSSSWTLGDPKIHDVYSDFNIYEYDLSSELFYVTSSGYEISKTYSVKNDFNGAKNNYNMLINNKPCTKEDTSAGQYKSQFDLTFYDLGGDAIKSLNLFIEMKFYQSKIELKIYNYADDTLQGYLREYIAYNGLTLRIIEGQYKRTDITSKDYVVYWLDYNNSILALSFYNNGELLVCPENPTREGYVFAGWTPAPAKYVHSNATYIATYHLASGNLLNQPIVYDLQAVNSGNGVTFIINETISEFNKFPYRLQVQVCYFDSKANNDYEVIETCTLETLNDRVINGTYTYKNALVTKEFIINSNYVSFEFSADVEKTVDGNGRIVFGDIQGAYVALTALTPKTPNKQYLFDHIKIMITSIETISV